jgi:hypothetical protein
MSDTNVTPIKTKRTPVKLKMVESHKLTSLMLEDFTVKGLSYKAYAAYATDVLGFEVTGQQVQTRVGEFEIPAGNSAPDAADLSALASTVLAQGVQIAELAEQVKLLQAWVNQTFPTKGRAAFEGVAA